jgi:hypothetical protein
MPVSGTPPSKAFDMNRPLPGPSEETQPLATASRPPNMAIFFMVFPQKLARRIALTCSADVLWLPATMRAPGQRDLDGEFIDTEACGTSRNSCISGKSVVTFKVKANDWIIQIGTIIKTSNRTRVETLT